MEELFTLLLEEFILVSCKKKISKKIDDEDVMNETPIIRGLKENNNGSTVDQQWIPCMGLKKNGSVSLNPTVTLQR